MEKEKNKKETETEKEPEENGASVGDLQKNLQECQRQKDEYLAGWQRARADFLNYKKEEAEHVSDLLKYSTENFISGLLPVLDSFAMAEKILSEEVKKDSNIQGMLQIKNQLLDFLKRQDMEEIRSLGEKFDPNFHEVIDEVEGSGTEAGIVVEEIQKGYTLQGRVIRPARVKISK